MALNRAVLDAFFENRKPYLDVVVGQELKEHEMKYSQMLNMTSTDAGWVDMASYSGHGLWSSKPELEDAQQDEILQGPQARVKIITYAQRTLVSQEMIEDEQGDGIIAQRLPMMLRSGRATQEVLGHDVFNSGFAGSLTPDGQYLFDSDHTNIVGTTFSNLLSAADLSQAALEAAILRLETMTDDRNIPVMQTAAKLLIHPSEKWNAQVILGSAQSVGNDYNNINPMFTSGLTVVESPYFTDTDAYFVLADQHRLDWIWRITPENWSEVDYVKGGVQIGARFRCATGVWDPRGAVGSAGGA